MYIYRGKLNWGNYAENEALTVIAPTSFDAGEPICTVWKWTTIPDKHDEAHFFRKGIIASKTVSGFTFLHPNYNFDAEFGDNLKSLTLVMRYGEDTQVTISLGLAYESLVTPTSVPLVYMGRMDWSDADAGTSAANETIIVVVPDCLADQKPICAFWQWTLTNGERKENVDCVDQVVSLKGEPESKTFAFQLGDKYRLEGNISDDGEQVKVIIANSKGQTSTFVDLALQAFFNPISTVYNDTQDVISCVLRASGTGTIDKIMAGVGLMLAVGGLAALAPAYEAAGAILAYLSAGAAIAGAVQVYNEPAGQDHGVLFPRESIQRHASGGILPNNDVDLLRAFVEVESNRSYLVVSFNSRSSIGQGKLNISTTLTDTWQELLRFQLPGSGTYDLVSYRRVDFPSMTPYFSIGGSDRFPDTNLSGTITSIATASPTPRPKFLFHEKLEDHKISDRLFTYDASAFVGLGEGVIPIGGDAFSFKLLKLPNGTVVLKLHDRYVDDPREPSGTRDLGSWRGNEDTLLALIQSERQSTDWAFHTTGDGGEKLAAVSGGVDVVIRAAEHRYVYVVSSRRPMTYQKVVQK